MGSCVLHLVSRAVSPSVLSTQSFSHALHPMGRLSPVLGSFNPDPSDCFNTSRGAPDSDQQNVEPSPNSLLGLIGTLHQLIDLGIVSEYAEAINRHGHGQQNLPRPWVGFYSKTQIVAPRIAKAAPIRVSHQLSNQCLLLMLLLALLLAGLVCSISLSGGTLYMKGVGQVDYAHLTYARTARA